MAYQTPYFVIDENQLTKDFQMLKSSLETSWGNYRIGYSFKTNSLPWLVKGGWRNGGGCIRR